MKRWYVQFCNPLTGGRDELWFPSAEDRQKWMDDFRSDFPLLQVVALEDVVRIQVEADYAGQRISAESVEAIIENRVANYHADKCLDCGTPLRATVHLPASCAAHRYRLASCARRAD